MLHKASHGDEALTTEAADAEERRQEKADPRHTSSSSRDDGHLSKST